MVYYGRDLKYHFCNGIKLKLLEFNNSTETYELCHLTDKSLNYDLILGRDILHKRDKIFSKKFSPQNHHIVQQKNSFSSKKVTQFKMQLKELNKFLMQNITRIIYSSNTRIPHQNYFRNMKKIFGGTLGKSTASDYTIKFKKC